MRFPLWPLALSLLIIPGTARKRIDWMTFMRCVDNNYSMIFSIDAMCVVIFMYAQYRIMQRASCTNCERYFHCRANYVPTKWCRSNAKSLQVIKTVSTCQDLAKKLDLREQLQDEEARQAGRAKKDCAAMYLAKAGCTYNPSTGVCLNPMPPPTVAPNKGPPKVNKQSGAPAPTRVAGGSTKVTAGPTTVAAGPTNVTAAPTTVIVVGGPTKVTGGAAAVASGSATVAGGGSTTVPPGTTTVTGGPKAVAGGPAKAANVSTTAAGPK